MALVKVSSPLGEEKEKGPEKEKITGGSDDQERFFSFSFSSFFFPLPGDQDRRLARAQVLGQRLGDQEGLRARGGREGDGYLVLLRLRLLLSSFFFCSGFGFGFGCCCFGCPSLRRCRRRFSCSCRCWRNRLFFFFRPRGPHRAPHGRRGKAAARVRLRRRGRGCASGCCR